MTRSISATMAGVLERLELERPAIITSEELAQILKNEGIKTPTRVVAARLRDRGWLLPTLSNGVWEFVPASSAGAFSSNDPLLPIKTLLKKNSNIKIGLTFQTAAWIHGIADRIPLHPEVAIENAKITRLLPDSIYSSVFSPRLPCSILRGVPVLEPESVIVHMAAKPGAVRSWQSALEWLIDLANMLKITSLLEEINDQNNAIIARTGYLLQGMRPDITDEILKTFEPKCKTWFGSRAPLIRHDNKWLIADTLLPFDPRKLDTAI